MRIFAIEVPSVSSLRTVRVRSVVAAAGLAALAVGGLGRRRPDRVRGQSQRQLRQHVSDGAVATAAGTAG